jgi:hypothetical protein
MFVYLCIRVYVCMYQHTHDVHDVFSMYESKLVSPYHVTMQHTEKKHTHKKLHSCTFCACNVVVPTVYVIYACVT